MESLSESWFRVEDGCLSWRLFEKAVVVSAMVERREGMRGFLSRSAVC